jgi:signal recognition particle receptor subunit alpha
LPESVGDEIEELAAASTADAGNDSDIEFSDSSVDQELLASRRLEKRTDPVEGRILSFFRSMTGQRLMGEEDVKEVMKRMKEHLIHKNVAANIADDICRSTAWHLSTNDSAH